MKCLYCADTGFTCGLDGSRRCPLGHRPLPAARLARRRAVAAAVALGPGRTATEVARAVGVAPQTAHEILARLCRDGRLVRREAAAGRIEYHPAARRPPL